MPKFLLDRFSDNGLVWCSDKKDSSIFRASTKDLCLARDYYETPGLMPNQIENGLSQIEGIAASILRRFDEGVAPEDLSKSERVDLSIFLSSLMFRTPFFESAISSGEGSQPLEENQVNLRIKELQIASMTDENSAFFIHSMNWQVVENKTPHEFMLSDCPMLRFRLNPTPTVRNGDQARPAPEALSIFNPEVFLVLPIAPNRILIMTHGQNITVVNMEEFVIRVDLEVNRVSERFSVGRIRPTVLDHSTS